VTALIFHIAARACWLGAQGEGSYRCDSLREQGFIHCSTLEQLLIPANERFRGRRDLVLLCIDVAGLAAELRYEDCYQSGMEFPHLYGAIEVSAVVDVLEFQPEEDGRFELPRELG
jgi:uncharacterized protein (DUF952 family)